MTFTVVALAALICVAVVAFARVKPTGLSSRAARRINTWTIVAVGLLWVAGITWMWLRLKGGPGSGRWTAVAVTYCVAVLAVSLVVASLVRWVISRLRPRGP